MTGFATIIPARGGSKGIPRKNLMDFCGKPLIAWSIEQALASSAARGVFVSTDDAEIAEVSGRYGAKVIRRPAELAADTTGMEPVIAHALREVGGVDLAVHLQPTSPVRKPSDIDGAVEALLASGADCVFSAAKLDDVCLWRDGPLESVTFDHRDRGRRQDRKPYYLENGSIYVFRPQNMALGGRLSGRIEMFLMPMWRSFEIDSREDAEVCEMFMRRLLAGG